MSKRCRPKSTCATARPLGVPNEMWVGIDLLGEGNFPRPRAELDNIVTAWFGDVFWRVTVPHLNFHVDVTIPGGDNVLRPCTQDS